MGNLLYILLKGRMIILNSLVWKRRIAKMYPIFYGNQNARKIILIYHAIGNGPWAISENTFKKQIQWLKENTQIVPLSDLLTSNDQKNKIQVALTFDDGYACLYDNVLPILSAENVTATVYVNTGWMGECAKTRKPSNSDLGHYPGETFLTWDEVRSLNQLGWEIGSHGVEHSDLTLQNAGTIKQELIHSKLVIEQKLQKECAHFAYTFGNHSKKVRDAVIDAGYHYAVAGHHKTLKKTDNPIALPRLNIEINYSMDDFKNIIVGKWDFLGVIHRIKKYL